MSRFFALPLFSMATLLAGCESAATVDDGRSGAKDDTAGGGDTSAEVSPWSGDWSGTTTGFAAFDGTDWEVDPYCEGDVVITVADDGAASGTGTCTILWGPYVDLEMDVTAAGTFSPAGVVALTVGISDPESERGFDEVALEGKVDATAHTLTLSEYTMYTPVGLDPIDASVRVEVN